MDMVQVEGTLPVAMKKMVGQDTITSKNVVIRQQTTGEYFKTQSQAQPDQYIAICDLAGMVKLVDEDGEEHEVTYDMILHTSRNNFNYLSELKNSLDAKEQAES